MDDIFQTQRISCSKLKAGCIKAALKQPNEGQVQREDIIRTSPGDMTRGKFRVKPLWHDRRRRNAGLFIIMDNIRV